MDDLKKKECSHLEKERNLPSHKVYIMFLWYLPKSKYTRNCLAMFYNNVSKNKIVMLFKW